jgi:TRAP-type C4-dicarboxylate transport system permease small subunit
VLAFYEAALARLDRATRWLVIICSALMILVVSVQVLLRYAFNTSIDWSDEVSRLLFVWCMFLAIPLGLREGSHVGIELLVQFVPAAPRRLLSRLCSLVAMLLMAVVLYFTVTVAIETWDELMPTLSVSTNWFLVPVAFCALHCLLHLIALLWRDPVRTSVVHHE